MYEYQCSKCGRLIRRLSSLVKTCHILDNNLNVCGGSLIPIDNNNKLKIDLINIINQWNEQDITVLCNRLTLRILKDNQ